MKKLTNFKFESVTWKLLSVIFLSVCIIFSICVYHSFAEVPCKINYQGRLIKDNVPVHNPTGVPMIFNVDGIQVYSGDVPVYNGLFRVVLDLEDKGIDWTAGEEKSLEVTVDGELLSPPEPIYAYPYAINSHLLEGATKEYFINTSAESQTKQGDLNIMGDVGIGTTSPSAKLHIHMPFGQVFTPSIPDIRGLIIESAPFNTANQLEFRDYLGNTITVVNRHGNIGIGTTSPQAKLHIDGTPGTDGIMFPDGTVQTTAGGGFDPADIDSTGWGDDSPGSVTFPNGLIFKWGKSAITTSGVATTTVSFPSAFPNACFNVVAVEGHSSGFNHSIGIHTVRKDSFRCYLYGSDGSPIRWFAVGR